MHLALILFNQSAKRTYKFVIFFSLVMFPLIFFSFNLAYDVFNQKTKMYGLHYKLGRLITIYTVL